MIYIYNAGPLFTEADIKQRKYEGAKFVEILERNNKEYFLANPIDLPFDNTKILTSKEIFLGDLPLMTEAGTFIINGAERVIVSQLVRSPSVYYKKEIDKKFDEIVEFSEVKQFIDTPVKRYSSGMYVKLAFSVAAHLDSEIMIMDEVLAVGDVKFQQKCLDKMSEAAHQNGRTVLYVSHNMSTIRRLCDRCIVLDHGKVVFDGDVDEAINIYSQDLDTTMAADVDLSGKRMKHLSADVVAKMTRITMTDKKVPVYEMNENIRFDLEIDCTEKIDNACMRLEIRTAADEASVGASVIHNFASLKNGKNKFKIDLCVPGLVPGKYFALLVLYQVNSVGAYDDLDAAYPTFVFEVQDTLSQLNIDWNFRMWGKIKLPQMIVENKNDT